MNAMRWVTGAVIGLLCAVALVGCDAGNGPSYAATGNGFIPSPEVVGQPLTATVTVRNTGDTMPHLILDISTVEDHWVVNGITSGLGSGSPTTAGAGYLDFGSFSGGASVTFTLALAPKDAGNWRFAVSVYPDLDTTGMPVNLMSPLTTLGKDVVVNG